ncbi:MAG: hypothetical protein ACE5I7_15405 [Candidatus Binatia bacterium]
MSAHAHDTPVAGFVGYVVAVPAYMVGGANAVPAKRVGSVPTLSCAAAELPAIPATVRLMMCTRTATIGSTRGAVSSNA